jgi:hypothetical protein
VSAPVGAGDQVSRAELWAAIDRVTANLADSIKALSGHVADHDAWHRDQAMALSNLRVGARPSWVMVGLTSVSSLAAVIVAFIALIHVG